MLEWKDVQGYEDYYAVSNRGEVWSKRLNRVMSPSTGEWGHLRVVLHSPGVPDKTETVHRLVKLSFDGPPPEGLVVCHNNGVPSDNRLENLRFGTLSSNMYDRGTHGTDHQRKKTRCPRGHLLAEPNLQTAKLRKGWRSCRSCHQARSDRFNGREGTLKELSDKRYATMGLEAGH